MSSKVCDSCDKRFPLENFYKHANKADGRYNKCKTCYKADMSRKQHKLKREAVEYLGGTCQHCGGVFHPAVFDFHHKDPATKDFGIAGKSCALEKITDELDKCLLLCANCHRMEHYA